MPKTSIKLEGFTKLERRMRRAMLFNRQSRIDAINDAAAIIEEAAKMNMKGSRTRALRMGRAVTAPSGVLGIDRGTLRSSITFVVRVTKKRITATIGPQRVAYGAIHEFGGTAGRGARIPARPYLGPALRSSERRVMNLLGKSFKIVR